MNISSAVYVYLFSKAAGDGWQKHAILAVLKRELDQATSLPMDLTGLVLT